MLGAMGAPAFLLRRPVKRSSKTFRFGSSECEWRRIKGRDETLRGSATFPETFYETPIAGRRSVLRVDFAGRNSITSKRSSVRQSFLRLVPAAGHKAADTNK